MSKFDGLNKGNIKGAHNYDEFLKLQQSHGIHISKTTPVGNGIYELEYWMPKRSNSGDITHYSLARDPKTVYDPTVWSDEKFLDLAQRAAAQDFTTKSQAFLNNPSPANRMFNTSLDGVDFRVYLNQDSRGNVFIDNIHPRNQSR